VTVEVPAAGLEHASMVVCPRSGSRRLRRNASIRLGGGAIAATDRRGRSCRFPIDGTDESPRGFRSAGLEGHGDYLEDRRGRALVRLQIIDWDPTKLHALDDAAGFKAVIDPGTPSDRPEMMKIEDPPYLAWASTSVAVGIAAVSLYWIHIAPEAVMLVLALPALILFAWFITLTKLAMPSSKEIRATQQRAAEMAPKALAEAEEILKRYGVEAAPEPEPDKP
jgi:hypothetical protein